MYLVFHALTMTGVANKLIQQSERLEADVRDLGCAKIRAAVRNVDSAAAVLLLRFTAAADSIAQRQEALNDKLYDRLQKAGCGARRTRYEVYRQFNEELPPLWPNWWVRPQH